MKKQFIVFDKNVGLCTICVIFDNLSGWVAEYAPWQREALAFAEGGCPSARPPAREGINSKGNTIDI